MAIAERQRLEEDAKRDRNWKRWGPYLSERQWGTVREDYSEHGRVWESFPHDHARSRAYRWGEDGLLGICDREARLCFALALRVLFEPLAFGDGHRVTPSPSLAPCSRPRPWRAW